MTPRFAFRPAARADLRMARDWCAAQQPGLELELRDMVDITLAAIRDHRSSRRFTSSARPTGVTSKGCSITNAEVVGRSVDARCARILFDLPATWLML